MNKLTNAVVFIIIGLVFATVVVSSVSTYQFNANGWDNDTRETVRGSGITYTDLFSENLISNTRFNTNDISEWENIEGADLSWDVSERMLQLTTGTVLYPYSKNVDIGNLIVGNVYYARYDYFTNDEEFTLVRMGFGTTSYEKTAVINSLDNFSKVAIATNGTYEFQTVTSNNSSSYSMYFDNFYLINLTDVYGAGNEPTVAQIDYWYQDYNNLTAKPQDNLKTIDGMVDFIPILFIIIVVAGAVLFIKTKES